MNRKGFTLIELLVVVIMVGILTSVALPQYRKAMDRARAAEVKQMLPALYEARERWALENGYHWDNDPESPTYGRIVTPDKTAVDPTYEQLDIEMQLDPASPRDSGDFRTKNFSYGLRGYEWAIGGGLNERSVYALPAFANSSRNNLTGTVISYTNGRVCCSVIMTPHGNDDTCERLDIPPCVTQFDDEDDD